MKENAWNSYSEQNLELMDALIKDYKYFVKIIKKVLD